MADEEIERVARALCKETFRIQAEKCPLWRLHIDDARAAVDAHNLWIGEQALRDRRMQD